MNVAICIPTYNSRFQLAEAVLSNAAEVYKKYNIDVYYFDSSEDDSIKDVIDNYVEKGYNNIKYKRVLQGQVKTAMYYSGISLEKKYDYIWAVKDRVFFDEKTLEKVFVAMSEGYDAILLGVLPQYTKKHAETKVYDKPEEFYLDWGFMATSIDVTVLKQETMLEGLSYETVAKCNPSFTHFELLFHRLVGGNKTVKVLVENDVVARNIQGVGSCYKDKMFEIWKDDWIKANMELPELYDKYKKDVIKHAGNLPWIFGTVGSILEYKKLGALTQENIMNIIENWEMVSDISKDTLVAIADDTYDIKHDLSIIPKNMAEIVDLLVEMADKLKTDKMPKERIPYESIFKCVMNNVIKKYNGNMYIVQPINGSVQDILSYICNKAETKEDIQKAFQVLISILILTL